MNKKAPPCVSQSGEFLWLFAGLGGGRLTSALGRRLARGCLPLNGCFLALLGHREAKLTDDLPQGEVLPVGKGRQPRPIQAELALLVQQGLVHVDPHHLG